LDAHGVHGEQAGEHAAHEDLGVGEVDELQHPVHERVAEGDQRVDRAQSQSIEGLGTELVFQTVEAVVDDESLRTERRAPKRPPFIVSCRLPGQGLLVVVVEAPTVMLVDGPTVVVVSGGLSAVMVSDGAMAPPFTSNTKNCVEPMLPVFSNLIVFEMPS